MNKTIERNFYLLLIFLIVGCNSQPMTETQQIASTPTVTPLPTATLPPTPHPLAITVQNASSLKLQKTIGAGTVNDVAWSPQGDVIVVAQDFDILLYDSSSLQLIGSIGFGGTEVVFSPDGKHLSIVGELSVIVWHISNNEVTWEFKTFDTWGIVAKHLAYNNQGSYLVFWEEYIYDASIIYALEVWDVNSGEQIYHEEEGGSDVYIEFSPKDNLLAIHTELTLRFIDLDTGEQRIELSLWTRDSFSFFDNNYYFGRTKEGNLAIMDIQTLKIKRALDIKIDQYASKFVVSPDKKRLLVFNFWNKPLPSDDIQIWDLEEERQLFSVDVTDNNYIPQVEISPDSNYLAVVDDTGYITKYDLETGELVGRLEFTMEVLDVEFLPVDQDASAYSILAGYSGGQVRIWNSNGQLIRKFEDHKGQVNSVSVNSDYSQLISASNDGTAKIWDIEVGSLIKTLACSGGYNFAIAAEFSYEGDFVALECLGGKIEVWDTKLWSQGASMDDGYDLQKLPAGNLLVSLFPISGDKFTVTNVLDKEGVYEFSIADEYIVLNASFSPNGKMLAAVDGENTVIVWEVGQEAPIYYLLEQGMECTYMECQEQSVAFSPDNSLLASSNEDQNLVRLWNVESGKQIVILDLMRNVNAVAFSPDGRYLIAGCDDGRIYVWGIE